MQERVPCEFFLFRYVPDVVKGEFVNIGVLLREAAGAATRVPEVRFTRDWSRTRCLHADADVALLEGLEQEIVARLRTGVSARDPKAVLDTLEDSLSNSVQMTEPKATLAENVATEIEQLMRLYVEPMRMPRGQQKSSREKGGRARLQAALRTEFERAGVWGLMRKRIAAAAYTGAGDPLKIDCGYRANLPGTAAGGTVKMFHAVSLAVDVESAKGLAFSAPQLRGGVERVEGARLEMTAVIEPLRTVAAAESEEQERYTFGVEAMERQEIRVVTLNDLARVAATAARELGL